jgi:hypothetical protein
MDINRELAELLGVLHEVVIDRDFPNALCACGATGCLKITPDFTSDPGKIELLRLMMKREDWSKFLFTINKIAGITVWGQNFIFVRYITDTTGLLAQVAVEFLRREK